MVLDNQSKSNLKIDNSVKAATKGNVAGVASTANQTIFVEGDHIPSTLKINLSVLDGKSISSVLVNGVAHAVSPTDIQQKDGVASINLSKFAAGAEISSLSLVLASGKGDTSGSGDTGGPKEGDGPTRGGDVIDVKPESEIYVYTTKVDEDERWLTTKTDDDVTGNNVEAFPEESGDEDDGVVFADGSRGFILEFSQGITNFKYDAQIIFTRNTDGAELIVNVSDLDAIGVGSFGFDNAAWLAIQGFLKSGEFATANINYTAEAPGNNGLITKSGSVEIKIDGFSEGLGFDVRSRIWSDDEKGLASQPAPYEDGGNTISDTAEGHYLWDAVNSNTNINDDRVFDRDQSDINGRITQLFDVRDGNGNIVTDNFLTTNNIKMEIRTGIFDVNQSEIQGKLDAQGNIIPVPNGKVEISVMDTTAAYIDYKYVFRDYHDAIGNGHYNINDKFIIIRHYQLNDAELGSIGAKRFEILSGTGADGFDITTLNAGDYIKVFLQTDARQATIDELGNITWSESISALTEFQILGRENNFVAIDPDSISNMFEEDEVWSGFDAFSNNNGTPPNGVDNGVPTRAFNLYNSNATNVTVKILNPNNEVTFTIFNDNGTIVETYVGHIVYTSGSTFTFDADTLAKFEALSETQYAIADDFKYEICQDGTGFDQTFTSQIKIDGLPEEDPEVTITLAAVRRSEDEDNDPNVTGVQADNILGHDNEGSIDNDDSIIDPGFDQLVFSLGIAQIDNGVAGSTVEYEIKVGQNQTHTYNYIGLDGLNHTRDIVFNITGANGVYFYKLISVDGQIVNPSPNLQINFDNTNNQITLSEAQYEGLDLGEGYALFIPVKAIYSDGNIVKETDYVTSRVDIIGTDEDPQVPVITLMSDRQSEDEDNNDPTVSGITADDVKGLNWDIFKAEQVIDEDDALDPGIDILKFNMKQATIQNEVSGAHVEYELKTGLGQTHTYAYTDLSGQQQVRNIEYNLIGNPVTGVFTYQLTKVDGQLLVPVMPWLTINFDKMTNQITLVSGQYESLNDNEAQSLFMAVKAIYVAGDGSILADSGDYVVNRLDILGTNDTTDPEDPYIEPSKFVEDENDFIIGQNGYAADSAVYHGDNLLYTDSDSSQQNPNTFLFELNQAPAGSGVQGYGLANAGNSLATAVPFNVDGVIVKLYTVGNPVNGVQVFKYHIVDANGTPFAHLAGKEFTITFDSVNATYSLSKDEMQVFKEGEVFKFGIKYFAILSDGSQGTIVDGSSYIVGDNLEAVDDVLNAVIGQPGVIGNVLANDNNAISGQPNPAAGDDGDDVDVRDIANATFTPTNGAPINLVKVLANGLFTLTGTINGVDVITIRVNQETGEVSYDGNIPGVVKFDYIADGLNVANNASNNALFGNLADNGEQDWGSAVINVAKGNIPHLDDIFLIDDEDDDSAAGILQGVDNVDPANPVYIDEDDDINNDVTDLKFSLNPNPANANGMYDIVQGMYAVDGTKHEVVNVGGNDYTYTITGGLYDGKVFKFTHIPGSPEFTFSTADMQFLAANEAMKLVIKYEVFTLVNGVKIVQGEGNANVVIIGENDAPEFDANPADYHEDEDGIDGMVVPGDLDHDVTNGVDHDLTFAIPVATDVDGGPITYTLGAPVISGGINPPAPLTVIQNPNGTFSLNPDQFQYLLPSEFVTLTIKVTADDGNGGIATKDVTVTIHGQAPAGQNDVLTVAGGNILTNDGDMNGNDTDGSGPLDVVKVSDAVYTPTNGAPVVLNVVDNNGTFLIQMNGVTIATVAANGQVVYSGNLGAGTIGFNYMGDGYPNGSNAGEQYTVGNNTTKGVTITVGGNPPVAPNVTYHEDEDGIDGMVVPGDLDNDVTDGQNGDLTFAIPTATDPDGDPLTYYGIPNTVLVNGVTYNINNINYANGTFQLEPSQFQSLAVGESVTITIPYTVSDGNNPPVTANITVVIHGANDAPEFGLDPVNYHEDEDGIDGSGIIGDQDSDVTNGVDHDLTFAIPVATDVDANDVVTYTLGAAMVSGGVNPPAPVTVTQNNNGTFSLNPDQFQYLLPNEFVTLTIQVTANDGHGGIATKDVTVTIHGQAPSGQNDVLSVAGGNILTNDGDMNGNDTDGSGALDVVNVFDAVYTPTNGAPVNLTVNNNNGTFEIQMNGVTIATVASNGQVIYSGNLGQGTIEFNYTGDGFPNGSLAGEQYNVGNNTTKGVKITIGNNPPTAPDVTYEEDEDGNENVAPNDDSDTQDNVLQFDIPQGNDPDGDPLTYDVADNPTNVAGVLPPAGSPPFTVTQNPNGTFNLDPAQFQYLNPNETVTLTIPYTVSDGSNPPVTATITVVIHGTNDIPEIPVDPVAVAVTNIEDEDDINSSGAQGVYVNNVMVTDADDSDAAPINGNNYSFSVPAATDADGDVLTYRLSESTYTTPQGHNVTIAQTAMNGNIITYTYTINSGTLNGENLAGKVFTVQFDKTNGHYALDKSAFQFLNASEVLNIQLKYIANDGLADSNTAIINTLIIGRDPVAADDNVTLNENTVTEINVITNDSDPDGDALTIKPGSVQNLVIKGTPSDPATNYISPSILPLLTFDPVTGNVTVPNNLIGLFIIAIGSQTITFNSEFIKIPDGHAPIQAMFQYTATDANGEEDTANVNLTINDNPDTVIITTGDIEDDNIDLSTPDTVATDEDIDNSENLVPNEDYDDNTVNGNNDDGIVSGDLENLTITVTAGDATAEANPLIEGGTENASAVTDASIINGVINFGNDTANGLAGDDSVFGDAQNINLIANQGLAQAIVDENCSAGTAYASANVTIANNQFLFGDDNLDGGAGDDILRGDAEKISIQYNGQTGTATGNGAVVNDNNNVDTHWFNNNSFVAGDDVITGGTQTGGEQNDTMTGDFFEFVINGQSFKIYGNMTGVQAVLDGMNGTNGAVGVGSGNSLQFGDDVFSFNFANGSTGKDIITDFGNGNDKVLIDNLAGVNSLADLVGRSQVVDGTVNGVAGIKLMIDVNNDGVYDDVNDSSITFQGYALNGAEINTYGITFEFQ